MPTKPLHNVPVKPRGLEAITIETKKFIKLLKDERTRQAKRASDAKRRHKQDVIRVLTDYLKEARNGGINYGRLRRKYGDAVINLPAEPVFRPCDYDQTIHRLEQDDRAEITISANEWNRFFPCDLTGDDE